MSDFLYHFTSKMHIEKILEDGYLQLTPSNLKEPKNLHREKNEFGQYSMVDETDSYKPVVWLTDKPDAENIGLDFDKELNTDKDFKKRIKITIPMQSKYQWWVTWADKNRMNKGWRKRLILGQRYGSWYISEEQIPLSDVELIEDLVTGEILLDNRK